MRSSKIFAGLGLALALTAGCHTNMVDKSAFKSAIDNYLSGQKSCLFSAAMKFPAQADTNNEEQTKGYDALTDAGLLVRTPHEKKRFLVGSKQVNDYDLSSQGRTNWTADPSEPGYGNFCFGSPKVTSVDNYSETDSSGNAYSVNYQYAVDLPDWAKSAEMKTAFPTAARMSGPSAATATLTKSDSGWAVQHAPTTAP